ncbi:MAG: PqqD family protein [Phycisphaerae bacterium]|nr:PqqD family protein [Phycisphaerae bacterium]
MAKRKVTAQEPDQSWQKMLLARPVRNAAAKVSACSDGCLRIAIPNLRPWYLFPPISWMVRPAASKSLVLEGLGAEVWDLCDGRRTVEEVTDCFAARHSLSFHESRVSITGYLRLLVQRGALAMVEEA